VTVETSNSDVSSVIALYNGATHIIDALESMLQQTEPPLEIIIVDDGSSDESLAVIAAFMDDRAQAAKLITIVKQENSGQGSARNRGVAEAKGAFIAFLDQDDSWEPTHIAHLRTFFDSRPKLGWVYTDFNEFDESSRFIQRNFLRQKNYAPPESSIFGLMSADMMMLPSSSLIRKVAFAAAGGFDTQFRGYEDDDLFFRIFVAGWSFEFDADALVNYRIHPDNSSRGLSFPNSRILFYRKYRDYFERDHDYFSKFFRGSLVPRMVSAAIQDAAVADRDDFDEARILAASFLEEIFTDTGFSSRSRLVLFLAKRKNLFRWAWRVRTALRRPEKSSKTSQQGA
jgi:glycosyltransferase involved in cell wall biosynthesis